MVTVEEIWKRLESIDAVGAMNPPESRMAADRVLGLLAELEDPPPDLRAFASQIDGTAWRALGAHESAERCYSRAEAIYCEALAGSEDRALRRRLVLGQADLRRRWSYLCLERLEWDRALEMLDFAEELFTLAARWHEVGRVCLARGQVLWERNRPGDRDQALELFSQALEMIDREERETAFTAAEHNLTWALSLHPNPAPESLERAFEALRRGRLSPASRRRSGARQRFGHAQLTVPDAKRRYLQGKVLLRLRQDDDARPFLETARRDLIQLGNYWPDVFAVTLDLAECYLWVFRHPWRRVADLLAETFALSPPEHLTREVWAALELFQAALERRSLSAARKHLETARRVNLLSGSSAT